MIQEINGWYYYDRRVPTYAKEYFRKNRVKISLKTKDKNEAHKRAHIVNSEYEKLWNNLIRDKKTANVSDYKRAKAIAIAHGIAYRDITDLNNKTSTEEIYARTQALKSGIENEEIIDSLLGLAEIPQIPLKDCEELYWPLVKDRLVNKSEHQIRKYKNPRIRSFSDFCMFIGENRDIATISRKDILDYRGHLLELISDGLNGDTANKKILHVKDILRTICNANEIPFNEDTLFAKTRFQFDMNQRVAFEARHVEETLLPALKGLNKEARMLVYIMADTGMRESEVIGLDKEDIVLDAEVPHVRIRPKANKALKTKSSERVIPLVGTALYAFKQMPNGFSRYTNADSASNLINKYLTNNNLRQEKGQSLYSLRHTFKDRLRDARADIELIDQLMGHTNNKPAYGRGHLLKTAHEVLEQIAFKVPETATRY